MSQEGISQEVLNSFLPPPILGGTPVFFWARGDKLVGQPIVAYAMKDNMKDGKVIARTMQIQTSTGMLINASLHADDPRLKLNADRREDGCWDYTPYHRWLLQTSAALRVGAPQAPTPVEHPAAKAKAGRDLPGGGAASPSTLERATA